MNVGKEIIQIQNRVTHDLPGAMICDITSAVYLIISGVFYFKLRFIQKKMLFIAAFSERVNVGMLTKKQIVGSRQLAVGRKISILSFLRNGFLKQFFLVIPAFFVVD